MTATCPKCKKSLKVKDEYAGKRLKCPGCGEAFQASATSAAAPRGVPAPKPKGAPTAAGSTAPQRVRPAAREQGPKVAINTNVVLLAGSLGAFALLVVGIVIGPVRAQRFRSAHEQQVQDDVRDVVEFAMKSYASHEGKWNPKKASGPTVGDVGMLSDWKAMGTPATTRVDGYGTLGQFEGIYHFDTGEVEVQMTEGGTMLPGGGVFVGVDGVSVAGGVRNDTSTIAGKVAPLNKAGAGGPVKIVGRVTNGTPDVQINGKKADIYYPPDVDEDGNVIPPPPKKK